MTTYTASNHSTNRELSGSQIEEALNNAQPLTGGQIWELCTEAGLNRSQTRAITKIAAQAPITHLSINRDYETPGIYACAGTQVTFKGMIGPRGAIHA